MEIEKMYVNKGNKLSYRDRLKILRWHMSGRSPTWVSRKFGISRQTVYVILRKFSKHSVYGLEDHRPGARRETLNPVFYANVVDLRKTMGWGACRIQRYFKSKGFSVPHSRINKVIQIEDLTLPKYGKKKRPKYISYEAENCNDQWHMDWSIDPLTKRHLLAIIDDKSRFVVFAGLFDSANAENTCIGLEKAISTYGAPKEIVTDNGSHFKNIHKKIPCEPLEKLEKRHSIKHVFIRAGYPQSNGKIERFFGSYKMEFPRMNYAKVTDCLTWVHFYNFERLHQSLDYKIPAQVYLKCQLNS